jgi:ubiquitin C-terminal hydrolase
VKRRATKTFVWSKKELPNFFIFQFGIYAAAGGALFKSVPQNLSFPEELHMNSRMRGISDETRYSLAGVAAHTSHLGGGHFVADVRKGSDWFHCSDGVISESRLGQALKMAGPYLYVYQRL